MISHKNIQNVSYLKSSGNNQAYYDKQRHIFWPFHLSRGAHEDRPWGTMGKPMGPSPWEIPHGGFPNLGEIPCGFICYTVRERESNSFLTGTLLFIYL